MKKIVICFIVSVALVLFVGYGVVAPRTMPKESPKVTTQKTVEPKKKPSKPIRYIEKDWAREYDIYGSLD